MKVTITFEVETLHDDVDTFDIDRRIWRHSYHLVETLRDYHDTLRVTEAEVHVTR